MDIDQYTQSQQYQQRVNQLYSTQQISVSSHPEEMYYQGHHAVPQHRPAEVSSIRTTAIKNPFFLNKTTLKLVRPDPFTLPGA